MNLLNPPRGQIRKPARGDPAQRRLAPSLRPKELRPI